MVVQAMLSGVTEKPVHNGTSNYRDVFVDAAGTGYLLYASGFMLEQALSLPFTVLPAVMERIAFSRQPPSPVPAGADFRNGIAAAVTDRYGNLVDVDDVAITLLLMPQVMFTETYEGGTPRKALLHTEPVMYTKRGIAHFPNASVTVSCDCFWVEARSGILASSRSIPMIVVPAEVRCQTPAIWHLGV